MPEIRSQVLKQGMLGFRAQALLKTKPNCLSCLLHNPPPSGSVPAPTLLRGHHCLPAQCLILLVQDVKLVTSLCPNPASVGTLTLMMPLL